jgi:hypothetical protein
MATKHENTRRHALATVNTSSVRNTLEDQLDIIRGKRQALLGEYVKEKKVYFYHHPDNSCG